MKRTRLVLGVALVSSLFCVVGCGQGTYRIPAVEPVVKPKPENDLLDDIAGGDSDDAKPAPTESKPSTTPPAKPESKAPEAKPEEPKPEAKPAEPAKSEPPKADATKAEGKAGHAKPATGKPTDKTNGKK